MAEALTRDGNVCPGVETIQNHGAPATGARRAPTSCTASSTRGCARCATLVDVESAMEEYLEQRDWRVNANANQGYSLGGLILNVAGKVTANYWLSNVFTPEAGQAHRDGDIHIHDLDMLSGYCAGWSLRQLLTEGFNGITGGRGHAAAPHVGRIGQIVNIEVMMAGDAKGRALHLSHPDLQHHARFRLGPSQHHAPVRDDGALLFPELPELGPGAAHGAHAAACSWTCASCSSAATVCSARPNRPARSAW